MITLEGIVLKERSVGEQDKFIDILTKEKGLIEICVKGAKKINGKSGSSTQLFAYSRFCIQERKDRFYLNSAEPIHIFYDLRSSLTKLSLAAYMAEVLRFCCVEEQSSENDNETIRLFLNTLHYLEKELRSEELLKCIFELRLMAEIGYMPNVLGCGECGDYDLERAYFSVSEGGFVCADCHGEAEELSMNLTEYDMGAGEINAVRHIVLADYDRLFNFRISESVQRKLTQITEDYLTSHLERSFGTLDFYKSLINQNNK